ncbi:MAG: phosphoribosylglycinamide formyltransferase [Oscillospiraceae bacterium]
MKRIAVLVSGGGTNLQALLNTAARGEIPHGEIALVVSSNPNAYALARAQSAGVPTVVLARKSYAGAGAFDTALAATLQNAEIDLVVLAGFLCIVGPAVLAAFPGRIVNVHPSLIPSFCGNGFYGLAVHRAALARGVKITGATVHLVNEVTDGGPILLQKAVPVYPADTPELLQQRVMEEAEWVLLPKAVEMLCCGQK